jgi:hypothetical protein
VFICVCSVTDSGTACSRFSMVIMKSVNEQINEWEDVNHSIPIHSISPTLQAIPTSLVTLSFTPETVFRLIFLFPVLLAWIFYTS